MSNSKISDRYINIDPRSWNWNKFGSGSRNLGDLLYLMKGESALKSSALHPPPRVYASTGIAQGEIDTIETSGKIPARNVTQQINYIVRFRDWRLTHSVTLALYVPKMGTIGSDEFNNRHLLAFQPSFYFQGLSERESSTSWS